MAATPTVGESNIKIIVTAIGVALAVFLFVKLGGPTERSNEDTVFMRMVFAAASVLIMLDVVEGAYLAQKRKNSRRDPHFWIYAFYIGLSWTILLVLIYWDGVDRFASQLAVWGPAGVLFGVILALVSAGSNRDVTARYDLDRPITDRALGGLYFVWPILFAALFTFLVLDPPDKGWNGDYLLFQLVFMGGIMPFYPPKKNFGISALPRLVGYALLLVGLFCF